MVHGVLLRRGVSAERLFRVNTVNRRPLNHCRSNACTFIANAGDGVHLSSKSGQGVPVLDELSVRTSVDFSLGRREKASEDDRKDKTYEKNK